MSSFPLLSTKLNLPARRANLVVRPRLLQKLDLSLQPGNRLTILSAPAGFGKTTLVVDWHTALARRGIPLTWLSLDEGDNDPARFVRYFIAALQKVQPGLGQAALAVLDLPQPLQVEGLMLLLINEIETVEGDFVFVLDDFHLIHDLAVLQGINYLVDHQPACLHLLLTTRTDPLLPLPRLRARAEVTEIRAPELRFTPAEAVDFMQAAVHLVLTPDQAASLDQSTEGWIAGLQIAAIALQSYGISHAGQANQSPIDGFLASFSGTHQYVFDYLAQEVLNQQPPGVIDFLYATSFLSRLTPGLCDAVAGRNDSAAILRTLDQSNLFLLPLDERRQWYRYHHLFADFLRAGLDPQRLPELNRRASAWCQGKGLLEEAVMYALAGQDWESAVRLLHQAIASSLLSVELNSINRWMDALPAPILNADPELCTLKGWISILQKRIGEAKALVESAEKALAQGGPDTSRGRMLGLKAQLTYGLGEMQAALRLNAQALSLMDPQDGFFRTMALNLQGQLERVQGNVAHSIAAFEEALRTTQNRPGTDWTQVDMGQTILVGNLILSYIEHNERRRADAMCREWVCKYTGPQGQIHPAALFIYLIWANLCYQANELEDARRYVLLGFELCKKMGAAPAAVGGPAVYAALQLIAGDTPAALATIRSYSEDARQMQLPWVANHGDAIEAWFQLELGNRAAAEAWAAQANLPPITQVDPVRSTEQFTQARLLLAQHNFEDARTLISNLRSQAERCEAFQHLLEIDILLAQAESGLGHSQAALEDIEKAARFAAPQGSLRFFLDDDVTDLVFELRQRLQDPADDLLRQFLDQVLALPNLIRTLRGEAGPAAPLLISKGSISRPGLAEPITPRELEVLELMAQGLKNAEIAARLYLTLNTLKAHSNSIYGKLDVHSRLQAVNRARQLGIIPDSSN